MSPPDPHDRAVEAALVAFSAHGGRGDLLLTIMGQGGGELDLLASIYCGVEREFGESDDELRLRCLENWRPA